MKQHLPITALLCIIATTSHTGQSAPLLDKKSFSLYEKEAPENLKDKIYNIVTYFFHGWDDPKAKKEINKLIPRIIKNSLKNKRNYQERTIKVYSQELAFEQMIQETINTIRQRTYNYALKLTNNNKKSMTNNTC